MLKRVKKIICSLLVLTIIMFCKWSNTYALSPTSDPVFEGIDVSNWQGYIDYNRVKNSGIEVVYIKASEGTTFKDPYFEYNYKNAKENGLKVGFYHFLTATNVNQAINQAQYFASVISGKAPDCKLAMDFEQFNGGINSTQINQISLAFMQKLQELTGKEVVVYSNLNDAQKIFNTDLSRKYPLWLAYWGNYNSLQNVNSSWQNWEGVQYTNRGIVSGINGYVDKNRFTRDILLGQCTDCPSVQPPDPDEQEIYHIVKRGDTLWALARKYGTTIAQIVQMNSIKNQNLIYAGQVLQIPNSSNVNEIGTIVYTVVRGDNLWNLAKRYSTTINQIVQINNIRNPNLIYPGQLLTIPYNVLDSYALNSYIVKKGDTLWGISRKYGVTVKYLQSLNGIKNARFIYPGQVIKIN